MPIQLDCAFRRTNTSPSINSLQCGNRVLMIWWYCGIIKNRNDRFQPLAKIAVRVQIEDNIFSERIEYRNVALEHLGLLRIGSLCKNNRVIARAMFEERKFSVLHEKGMFWFNSFHSAAEKGYKPPFPQSIHRLQFQKDRNWMVQFKLSSGGTLLIPTLEYFTRSYGRSGKLRRYLTIHKWTNIDGIPHVFFEPLNQPEEQGKWKINVKKGFYNGDAIFLAHLKYDSYTQGVVKNIVSRIETDFKDDRQAPIFPKIGPWFRGSAELSVRGIPFNDGKSFLGLQITGISQPMGETIDRIRDNRNNALTPAGSEAKGNAWAGMHFKSPGPRPEVIDLTAYEEPDQGTATLELEDPEIKVLGARRTVRNLRDDQANDKNGSSATKEYNSLFSSGDTHGSHKGVDRASIYTPEISNAEMESEGALRDIWNAVQHLRVHYDQLVSSVEWYALNQGFSEDPTPQLISLQPYKEDETFNGQVIPASTRKWPFLDPETQSQMRGILVIRITINDQHVYIVESQRRVIKQTEKNGSTKEKEEPFRGLVFKLNDQEKLTKWIKFIRSNIRQVEGRLHKLTSYCPGEADVFKHVTNSNDYLPCWSALKNALKKVGITLKSIP